MSQDDLPASRDEEKPEPELPEVESEFTACLTTGPYGGTLRLCARALREQLIEP